MADIRHQSHINYKILLDIAENIHTVVNQEALRAILKILKLEKEFPGIIKEHLFDHIDILADSARIGKYPLNNWLLPEGKKADKKTNYRSIQNHIDQENQGIAADHESGRPPRLHAACRLMMDHVRKTENIKHPKDEQGVADSITLGGFESLIKESYKNRGRSVLEATSMLNIEAAELSELFFKKKWYGKEFTSEDVKSEAGDILNFLTFILQSYNLSLNDAMEDNIGKLYDRKWLKR
jgi:NTP pyrophosphatase (non-canonical NTP hydrolase)